MEYLQHGAVRTTSELIDQFAAVTAPSRVEKGAA
jgi:hypothetical protein